MISKSKYMEAAIEQAEKAMGCDEVPVGAIIVERSSGDIIAQAHNMVETDNDPTAHAELLAIRAAAEKLNSPRLTDCDIYVSLEPCPMCAQAISFARIKSVYYGAYDPKGGGVDNGAKIFNSSSCHHKPDIYSGIYEKQCGKILKDFFTTKR